MQPIGKAGESPEELIELGALAQQFPHQVLAVDDLKGPLAIAGEVRVPRELCFGGNSFPGAPPVGLIGAQDLDQFILGAMVSPLQSMPRVGRRRIAAGVFDHRSVALSMRQQEWQSQAHIVLPVRIIAVGASAGRTNLNAGGKSV